MHEYYLTTALTLINKYIDLEEGVLEELGRAEALSSIALRDNFLSHPYFIVNSYLGILHDIINHVRNLSEQSLSALLNDRRLLLRDKEPGIH